MSRHADARPESPTDEGKGRALMWPLLLILALSAVAFFAEAWSAWTTQSMAGRCEQARPGAVCTHARRVGEWLFTDGTPAQGYAVMLGLLATVLLLAAVGVAARLRALRHSGGR